MRRRLHSLVLSLVAGALLAPAGVEAKKMTLPELLDQARAAYPGLHASAAATAAMEAQVSEAQRYWLPSGELLSLLSPSPGVTCQAPDNPDGTRASTERGFREQNCLSTSSNEASISNVSFRQVFTRTEVRLIQPIWDFGKISAGVAAARAGVDVSREREAGARADLELNVRKAYYGLKLARELIATLEEGSGYVDEGQKKIEGDLAKGIGTATVTDKLRLRTVRAEVDARLLEAKRMADLARDGLRALLGPDAPADLDVDDDALEPIEVKQRPVSFYEDQARFHRPEVRLLDHALRAKHALADLERRKEYPDLVLVGTATLAYAGGVDNPQNAFFSHYFNSRSAGVAAALRMQLDLGPKLARADRTRAEASEIEHRRSESLGGITFEVRKAYGELTEAQARTEAVHKGEKAGKAWISAVAQNFAVGLAEARDLSDALLAFFQMRARYLQSVYDLNIAASSLTRATGTTP
ncbi:MAG TPA: TolC family protein [Polyangia bacterium]|nr:TolC family protein [Polyangia bacterium]